MIRMKILIYKIALLCTFWLVACTTFAAGPRPVYVKITTTKGTMKVLLYDDTPRHRDNFVKLVQNGTYTGLLFHRVIRNFMIQGGDPDSRHCDSTTHLGSGGLGYTVPAEIVFPAHYHKRGALCAARMGDAENPQRASSSIQFYIVVGRTYTDSELNMIEQRVNDVLLPPVPFHYSADQRRYYKIFGGSPHLDAQYTVFGEVVEGFDVLQAISEVPTGSFNRPQEDVRILKMKITNR